MYFMTDTCFRYTVNDKSKTAALVGLIKNKSEIPANLKIPARIGDCNITAIYPNIFCDCSQLQSVKIPDTVEYINNCVFKECVNLKSVTLYDAGFGANSLVLGAEVFAGCRSLETFKSQKEDRVIMASSLTFAGCTNLTELIGSFADIGTKAFFHCEALEKIVFADAVTFSKSSFLCCKKLKTIVANGDISRATYIKNISWLCKKNIQCKKDSNLIDLCYEGANVKIINI